MFQCKESVRVALLWLEQQEPVVVYVLVVGLFTVVSFPLTWGYVLLNVACGYLLGTARGLLLVAVAAAVGLSVAHLVLRTCLAPFAAPRLLRHPSARALLALLAGPHAFKLILCARLTPVPFGLQNTLFAVGIMTSFLLNIKDYFFKLNKKPTAL